MAIGARPPPGYASVTWRRVVESYTFLSPEWIAAARAVREAHAGDEGAPVVSLRMNLVVEGVPFGGGLVDAHLDTTSGVLDVDLGHVDSPDVKVRLDYETARAVLVDGDSEAAMAAFMAGKIRVEGDMTKLLAYEARPITPGEQTLAARLRDITTEA